MNTTLRFVIPIVVGITSGTLCAYVTARYARHQQAQPPFVACEETVHHLGYNNEVATCGNGSIAEVIPAYQMVTCRCDWAREAVRIWKERVLNAAEKPQG